jgi:septum formation protein
MLVLASASPRRRELLTQAGFTFEVHPADIPEDPYPNEDPIAYVTRLAREKAQAVFRELATCQGMTPVVPQASNNEAGALSPEAISSENHEPPGAQAQLAALPGAPGPSHLGTWETTNRDKQSLVVLGADTTVTLDNHILGKPENPADAARMLRLLSGRAHQVITGVALVTANRTEAAAEVTTVQFLPISDQEIADYVATGEPMDKAGAYAIQGRAARWIPRIEGCYFNVVGLPIALVSTLLKSIQVSDSPSR